MRRLSTLVSLGLLAAFGASCGSLDEQQIEEIISGVAQTAAAGVTYVPATPDVNVVVQQTFAAMTVQAAATQQGGTDNIPTNTPPGGLSGSISGNLGYPAEGIPPLAVVAFRVGGQPNEYYYVVTQQNQTSYQLDNLPPGSYYVVAYVMLQGNMLAGGYTQAVLCGLSANCTDHSLIPAAVNGGQLTSGISPTDWYAPPGTFPANPLP